MSNLPLNYWSRDSVQTPSCGTPLGLLGKPTCSIEAGLFLEGSYSITQKKDILILIGRTSDFENIPILVRTFVTRTQESLLRQLVHPDIKTDKRMKNFLVSSTDHPKERATMQESDFVVFENSVSIPHSILLALFYTTEYGHESSTKLVLQYRYRRL